MNIQPRSFLVAFAADRPKPYRLDPLKVLFVIVFPLAFWSSVILLIARAFQ